MAQKTLLLAMLLASTYCHSSETITLRADVWYPMNGDPDSQKPGYMIEVAKKILEPAGYTVEYDTIPWKRALDDVRSGQANCAVGAYKVDAPDFIFPEEELGIDETYFYTKSNAAWSFNGVESLTAVQLGYVGGYGYGDPLDGYLTDPANKNRIQAINSDNALEQNIKKLIANRIDATLESKYVMSAKLSDLGLIDNIKAAGSLGNQSKMYIACSPKNANSKTITNLITKGIQHLRTSGELTKILTRYGLNDWK